MRLNIIQCCLYLFPNENRFFWKKHTNGITIRYKNEAEVWKEELHDEEEGLVGIIFKMTIGEIIDDYA